MFSSPSRCQEQANLLPFHKRSGARDAEAIFHSQTLLLLLPISQQLAIYVSLFLVNPSWQCTMAALNLISQPHQHLFPWPLMISREQNIHWIFTEYYSEILRSWSCVVVCTLASAAVAQLSHNNVLWQRHWKWSSQISFILPASNENFKQHARWHGQCRCWWRCRCQVLRPLLPTCKLPLVLAAPAHFYMKIHQ